MSRHAAAEPPFGEWRRLSEYLWVGSTEHGPIGMVERGRRFNAIDTEGNLLARCHELREAQHLLEHLADLDRAVTRSVVAAA